MARREDVVNSIYDDLDHLSNDALAVYIWSWTNKSCGMAGLYKIAKRKIYESRLEGEALDAALKELEVEGLLFYERNVLWVKGRIKRLSAVTTQIGKSIAKDLNDLDPDHPLLHRCVEKYESHPAWAENVEPHLKFTRGSSEPQNSASSSEIPNLTRTSREVHLNLRGRGSGYGRGSCSSREEGSRGETPPTEGEQRLAFSIITAFSSMAQQRFNPDNWTDSVVACLRANPDLTEQDHLAIIRANFAKPWWKTPPSPAVLYSEPSTFDSAIAKWRGAGPVSSGSAGIDQAEEFARMAREAEAEERSAA